MNYQLHDSQINRLTLGENMVELYFSQGFWATDDHGKEIEQMNNCKIIFEIDTNNLPIEDFVSVRISKNGSSYKSVSLKKLVALMKKSPFDIDMEYDCSFANRKMLQVYSNQLKIKADIFIEEIKNVKYIHM